MESYQNEIVQSQPIRQIRRYVLNIPPTVVLATAPGSLFEILYFLAFIYGRILPNYGIYLGGGFGTAQISIMMIAGLILFTQFKRLPGFFYVCLLFPVLIAGSMWLVDLTIFPGFWRSNFILFVSQLGTWIGESIIISYLITRPGFLKRLIFLMFLTVVLLMRFSYYEIDFHVQRLTLLTNGFLANSNDLAAWAGFCAICLAMWAFSAQTWFTRIVVTISCLICFDVVAQTVSRASMLLSIGMVVIFVVVRALILKRGLSTIFIVLGLGLLVFLLLSLLDGGTLISNFSGRIDEDSGRDMLWSLSLPIVMSNPLGIGSQTIFDPIHRVQKGPHNVLLYFGLIAGWLPIILTILFYIVGAIRMRKRSLYEGWLWIPALLIYAIFEHNQSNAYYFELWSIIAMSICMLPANFEFQPKTAATSQSSP